MKIAKGSYGAVLSTDADMLYHLVPVFMRSGLYVKVYELDKVLEGLVLNRNQFQALGIVCKNDYSKNVRHYGFETNLNAIRSIQGENLDTVAYVKSYVAEINRKGAKNKKGERIVVTIEQFQAAISIFVYRNEIEIDREQIKIKDKDDLKNKDAKKIEFIVGQSEAPFSIFVDRDLIEIDLEEIKDYDVLKSENAQKRTKALKKFEGKLKEFKRQREEYLVEKEYPEKSETRSRLNENNHFPLRWADNPCRSIGFKDMEGKGTPKARYSHKTNQDPDKIVSRDSQDAPPRGSRKKAPNKKAANGSRKKAGKKKKVSAKPLRTDKRAMDALAKRKKGVTEESKPEKKEPREMTSRAKIKKSLDNQAIITLKIGKMFYYLIARCPSFKCKGQKCTGDYPS